MSGSWKVRGGSRREEANLNFRGGGGAGGRVKGLEREQNKMREQEKRPSRTNFSGRNREKAKGVGEEPRGGGGGVRCGERKRGI